MSEFVVGANADTTAMPFTKFVNDSEAAYVRDHPGVKFTPLAESEIGKVILEQEAKVAAEHAAGRVSDDELEAFRALGEARVESLKSHMQDEGEEIGDGLESWKHDAVASWQDFKAEHPEVIADVEGGNPSVASMATSVDLVVEVVDPLFDPIVDGAHGILDAVGDELGETAQQMVEARAEQAGADADEIELSRVKVEVARDRLDADIDKGHAAMDAMREQVHTDLESASEAAHSYAEAHPDSHLNDVNPAAISDPHIQEAIQQETQVAEA